MNKDKLNEAFELMRAAGLVARQNYKCCCNCAGVAMADEVTRRISRGELKENIKGICFYHQQDADDLRDHGECCLSYGSVKTRKYGEVGRSVLDVGKLVCKCLKEAGVNYKWSGNVVDRILVLNEEQ